jgi:hypothetical protein
MSTTVRCVITQPCCPDHGSWDQLAEHLRQRFPDIDAHDIEDHLAEAEAVMTKFQLPDDDRLPTAEIIVRYRLMVETGESPDRARLDPESHPGRLRPTG